MDSNWLEYVFVLVGQMKIYRTLFLKRRNARGNYSWRKVELNCLFLDLLVNFLINQRIHYGSSCIMQREKKNYTQYMRSFLRPGSGLIFAKHVRVKGYVNYEVLIIFCKSFSILYLKLCRLREKVILLLLIWEYFVIFTNFKENCK